MSTFESGDEVDSVSIEAIHINVLPPELLANILARLNIADRCRAAQVCATWWHILMIPQLWRHPEVRLQLDKPYHPAVLPSLVARGIQKVKVEGDSPVGLSDLLRQVPHLRSLSLHCSQYLPDLVLRNAFSERLDNITVLSLAWCAHLRDETLAAIGRNLHHLHKLCLYQCSCFCKCTPGGITDAGIEALVGGVGGKEEEQCRQLSILDLNFTSTLTDDSLLALSKLTKLYSLYLSTSNVFTDRGLNHLLTQSKLVTLHVEGCDIANIFLGPLSGSLLVSLYICMCEDLNDRSLRSLSKLIHLRYLHMAGCNGVGDEGLAYLVESNIACLCLNINETITDVGLGHLSRMATLHVLYLFDCNLVGEPGAALLAESKSIESLLWFCRSERISETGFDRLTRMSSLRECTLSRCACLEDLDLGKSNVHKCIPSIYDLKAAYKELSTTGRQCQLVVSACQSGISTEMWQTLGWEVEVDSHWDEIHDDSDGEAI